MARRDGARQGQRPLHRRYLDLVESVLVGGIYEDPPMPIKGFPLFPAGTPYDPGTRDKGKDWPSQAMTMVGRKRLRNFRTLVERAITDGIPGDIIETGVWRGGASIMARAVLEVHGQRDRKVIVADSFEGLPPPSEAFPQDAESILHEHPELAISLEQVQANFDKFGLLDDQVVFLKGWFKDTMPLVTSERLAVIRLDGDMYESTIDPLNHLFDRLSPGGWLIVDDYGAVAACKQAVHDFLGARDLKPEITQIDQYGVYFQKT